MALANVGQGKTGGSRKILLKATLNAATEELVAVLGKVLRGASWFLGVDYN